MMNLKNARDMVKKGSQVRWVRLVIAITGFVVLSFALAYLFQSLARRFNFPIYEFAWLAYLIVFGTSLLANLTILAPVPFAASIMIAAATKWNPVLLALAGSLGGTIGELSGYSAGYLGKKIAIPESVFVQSRVERWVKKFGPWAIFVLAFQPIIPFDIGGLVAGAVRMPLPRFLLALWAGKFLKFILLIYAGAGLINLFNPG